MLVGRESEFARLTEVVENARAARGSALLVRGEPGIGKTALLADLARAASEVRILRARGLEAESTLAYAGLTELLAPTLELLPRLPGRRRAALEAALGLGDETAVDPFGAYTATLSLLAEAADEQPTLVLVDDAHLLDAESANALRFSARRLAHDRVAMVLAVREWEGVEFESAGFDVLHVRGLDRAAAGQLLRAEAGEIAPGVLDELHRATAGNPLALRELARLLSAEQLAGRDSLPEPLPAGPDVTRAFGLRIDALPSDTQQALVVAAADDSGDLATVGRALRSLGVDLKALDAAHEAALVALEAGAIEFAHPLIRTTAYGRVTPNARRDAHLALAAALQDEPTRRARRAWHLAAATVEPDEQVAQELERVAADALARAAPAVAGRALEAAVRISQGPERVRRLLAAAAAHNHAGAADRAVRLLDTAIAETDDPLVRADAQRLRTQVQVLRDPTGAIRSRLVEEAARVEPHDQTRAAAMRLDAAVASVMMGEPRTALELAEQAWPVARHADPWLRPFAALTLCAARTLRGDLSDRESLMREFVPALEQGAFPVLGVLAAQVSWVGIWHERLRDARAHAERAVARIRAEGLLASLPLALNALAWVQALLGDWRSAEATAHESIAIARELNQAAFEIQPQTALALVAGAQGRVEEGRTLAARALEQGSRYEMDSGRTMAGWTLGRLELGIGDYEAAVAILEPTGRFSLDRGLEEPAVAPWAQELTEAYIRLGRRDEAEATLRLLEHQAERSVGRLAHAAALRCRGLLADGDFDRYFREALEWHEGLPNPFERARTLLCYGERLRRARRRTEARAPLRAALSAFDELGAEPWAKRAAAELEASGEHARRRTPDTADRLTPQERQVAALVAGGASNREAAAALFVSPKTIETHLAHIYRKLGVRSRAQLAARLLGADGPRGSALGVSP